MTRMTPRVLALETALQYTFINEELLSSEARFFFFLDGQVWSLPVYFLTQ